MPFLRAVLYQHLAGIKGQICRYRENQICLSGLCLFGPDSNTAAEASHCAADQNKFWQYHDYLFSHQGAEGSGWATSAHQKQFAQAVGLNMTQFDTCLNSAQI